MVEFRRFLLQLRRIYAKHEIKSIIYGVIITFILVIGAIIVDIFLGWGLIFQIIRMLIAVGIGVVSFSTLYINSIHKEKIKAKNFEEIESIRSKFSHKQRKNIALISILPLVIIVFLFATSPGPVFTLVSGVVIMTILGLISFVRTSRTEEVKKMHNIPDVRDVMFQKNLVERTEELKRKRKEEQEKHKKSKDDSKDSKNDSNEEDDE